MSWTYQLNLLHTYTLYDRPGHAIGCVDTEPTAKTIVRDHNAHEPLMRACKRVKESMPQELRAVYFPRGSLRNHGTKFFDEGGSLMDIINAALELGKKVTP